MGINILSFIGVVTVIAIAGMVIPQENNPEPQNLTCENDNECIDKMELCNVFCHIENQQNGDNQQGKCVEMAYVSNGMYPECD